MMTKYRVTRKAKTVLEADNREHAERMVSDLVLNNYFDYETKIEKVIE